MDQSNFRENRLMNSESSNLTIYYGSSILAFPVLQVVIAWKGLFVQQFKGDMSWVHTV